jgi:hypothetical protein
LRLYADLFDKMPHEGLLWHRGHIQKLFQVDWQVNVPMDEFHDVSDAVAIGLKGFSGIKKGDIIRRQGQSSGRSSVSRVAPQRGGDAPIIYVVARYIPEMRLVRPH